MSEKNIEKLLKKYKYDSPMCEFCGGRVIRDREWVCSVCGIVQGEILDSVKNPYNKVGESEHRKRKRESDWSKKLHKGNMKRKRKATIIISRDVKTLLTKYLEGRAIYQYQFLDKIILDAISDDSEKE